MPITQPYAGYATIVKLDYGHQDPEFSLILVPDRWSDLVELLELPYEYLRKARQTFTHDSSASDHYWDVYGPLTIILDPLTVPSRTSAEGLRVLSTAVRQRGGIFTAVANNLDGLIPNWQARTHFDWKDQVQVACKPVDGVAKTDIPCPGFFVVEYALVTRVMVIRYVPPALHPTYFKNSITPVTFSDFLVNLPSGAAKPREAFMHFDLINPKESYTPQNVALMKAQFAADYVVDPIETLKSVTKLTNARIEMGGASFRYHYTAAMYGRSADLTKPVGVQQPANASTFLVDSKPVVGSVDPVFTRINGDYDPTVILESVDPWASDWIWTHVPCVNPYNIDGRFPTHAKNQLPQLMSGGSDSPQPCALIYVTMGDGSGQWVIDPSSLLLKNYFAPTIPGGP